MNYPQSVPTSISWKQFHRQGRHEVHEASVNAAGDTRKLCFAVSSAPGVRQCVKTQRRISNDRGPEEHCFTVPCQLCFHLSF